MSKLFLKKIINNSELPLPEVICFFDGWEACILPLILSNVRSHLQFGRRIEYFCYSRNPSYLAEYLEKDKGIFVIHDLYSDPLGWNQSSSQHLRATSLPSELIEIDESLERQNIIVIDRLDSAFRFIPEDKILRDINQLRHNNSISQIILYCGIDLLTEYSHLSLNRFSTVTITLKSSNPLICDILYKKKSGNIIKTCEEFTLNSHLNIESLKEVKKKIVKDTEEELSFQTTFNLSLTEDQKIARNKVVLPHTRIQASGGGQIHYIPDKEDDWDDEDPDEDLEI